MKMKNGLVAAVLALMFPAGAAAQPRLDALGAAIDAVQVTPLAGPAQQPGILQSAERAAQGAELRQLDAPVRRRSMGRTWAGVGMTAVGALLAMVEKTTITSRGGSSTTKTEWYKPLGYSGAALAVTGVLLATAWSDVPVNPHIDFAVTPERIQVGKTFGF